MRKFIVGVAVERTQSTEVLVAVMADSLEEALKQASIKARKLGQSGLQETLRNVDWETDGFLDVGWGTGEYDADHYRADYDFTGGES